MFFDKLRKKDNVNVEVGLFDEGQLNILMPDDFIESINSSEQNPKVLKKVNIFCP